MGSLSEGVTGHNVGYSEEDKCLEGLESKLGLCSLLEGVWGRLVKEELGRWVGPEMRLCQ